MKREGLDVLPTLRRLSGEDVDVEAAGRRLLSGASGRSESDLFGVATFYPSFKADGTPGHEPGLADAPSEILPPASIEVRRVLGRCGRFDPLDLDALQREGAYEGLRRAMELAPEAVLRTVAESGLRGMGGAAFPAAAKWETARRTAAEERFVVCNAAEGDLGASMDRLLLERDPHLVIEGTAIAAFAVGARRGFIYLRSEYEHLLPHLETALSQARAAGMLGRDFDLEVFLAAGRYVCGEESALLESMEGRRGVPRLRPPFPARSGLWGLPTVVHNVKTLASVSLVVKHGAEWFREVGTQASPGTVILGLAGEIERPCVIEVPMGTPLRRVIEECGGGASGGRRVKAVQTGGPMGAVLPEHLLDAPLSPEGMAAAGSPLGSGGLIVLSESTCMVGLARLFARFAAEESCGWCAPCRLGTRQVSALLEDDARPGTLELIEEMAAAMRSASFCAYGRSATGVVASLLRHFRDEFDPHVHPETCATGGLKWPG